MVAQGDGKLSRVLKGRVGKWQWNRNCERNETQITSCFKQSLAKPALLKRCPPFYCFLETSEALKPCAIIAKGCSRICQRSNI